MRRAWRPGSLDGYEKSRPVYLETFRRAALMTPLTTTKISTKSRNIVGWKSLGGRECGRHSEPLGSSLLWALSPSVCFPLSHSHTDLSFLFFNFHLHSVFYSLFPFEPFWNRRARQPVLISPCKESGIAWVEGLSILATVEIHHIELTNWHKFWRFLWIQTIQEHHHLTLGVRSSLSASVSSLEIF